MVQDFITSFDRFEKFALSEMAKQSENNDPLSPLSPKFWSNINTPNSMVNNQSLTSLFDTLPAGCLTDFFSTPRRSGRIANQMKINYNEHVAKKDKHPEKSRPRKQRKRNTGSSQYASRKNRIEAIKNLFGKPTHSNIVKTKPKSVTKNSSKRSLKLEEIANEFRISIPLMQTTLLNSSVTKASLKLFDDVLTMKNEYSNYITMELPDDMDKPVEINSKNCNIKNYFDDTSEKNTKYEPKNFIEAFPTRDQLSALTNEASNEIQSPTENKFGNGFDKSFTDVFKCFIDSSKKAEKLKNNHTFEAFDGRERSDTNLQSKTGKTGLIDTMQKGIKKLEQNIVNEANQETGQLTDDFMEVSEETGSEKTRNERFEDFQMLQIPNESVQCSEEKQHFSEDNGFPMKTHKPEQEIVKEPSEEKERPLDLTMDFSEENCRSSNIEVTQVNIAEENKKFSEDLTILEASNEIHISNKKYSDSARNSNTENYISIFDSLKKNGRPDQNFTNGGKPYVEESDKIKKKSKPKTRNARQSVAATQAFEVYDQLSDNLSIMKICEKTQKATEREVINHRQNIISAVSEENPNDPFDLTKMEVSKLQSPTMIDLRNDTPTFNDRCSDITEASNEENDVIVDNKPRGRNTIAGILKKCQTQSSSATVMEELNENEKDHQVDVSSRNEEIIIEELKSLIDECPLEGCEKSYDVDLTQITHSLEGPAESVGNEIEIYEESSDSEIEVIEEEFLNGADNENREDFSKISDDVEMLFPQGYHRVYQEEYIEVIHQYNCFPSQSYQYHRYEYPIQENKFDYRPNNLSVISQRYGEYQTPEMHLDYNNYGMQVHAHDSFEHENKLEITEYYEQEKDNQELDLDKNDPQNSTIQIKPRSNSDQNQLILSQPPPIQCSYVQRYPQLQNVSLQRTQMSLQSQTEIEQVCENSLQIQEYSQNNNSEQTYNQWPIVSVQNSRRSSSEQRVDRFFENNDIIQITHNNEENQSQSQIIQRLHQVPIQLQTQIIQKQHQVMSTNNVGHQSLSQIAHFVKNNCHIHDVKFGKIKTLNGRQLGEE